MERIHPGDTHGLHTIIFISFFNFRLGPGVYTAALEKCMHAHSWIENQAAEILFCFLSFPFLFIINPKSTGGGGGWGQNPPPSMFCAIISRNFFSAPQAFMTFFFEVLCNFWRNFRKNQAYGS